MSLKSLGPNDEIIDTGKLSKRLESMYQGRKARDMSRIIPIEHMISAIAYRVADYVNKNTRFGEAASTILNNSALVQMYTDTKDSADLITITKLNAVYPSQTVTGVLLDASKAYMSTQGKGNFTFEILKNGAKPSDVNPMDSVDDDISSLPDASTPVADLDKLNQKRADIQAARDDKRQTGDEKSLGRKRRRQRVSWLIWSQIFKCNASSALR